MDCTGTEMFYFRIEVVDIRKQKKWLKYRYDIPVVHVNNEFFCKHVLNSAKLLSKIEAVTTDNNDN